MYCFFWDLSRLCHQRRKFVHCKLLLLLRLCRYVKVFFYVSRWSLKYTMNYILNFSDSQHLIYVYFHFQFQEGDGNCAYDNQCEDGLVSGDSNCDSYHPSVVAFSGKNCCTHEETTTTTTKKPTTTTTTTSKDCKA